MPRISGFSDFARNLANHLVDRESPVTTRVGAGELRSFLAITTEDERRIRDTIFGAIGEGYDFCERNFDSIKAEAMDYATRVTFQVVAEEMGLSQDGTAKEIQDRIFAEFHRLKKKEDTVSDPDAYVHQGKMAALSPICEALGLSKVGEPFEVVERIKDKIKENRFQATLDLACEFGVKEGADESDTFKNVRLEMLRLRDIERRNQQLSYVRDDVENIGYKKAVKEIAMKIGIPAEGTAEHVFWNIIDHFFRSAQDQEDKLKEERKAGAKEERKRIEEMILRHKKGYEEQASEYDKKARSLKSELEDVERMAEEYRRDVDAHQAVWSLVVIDDAVADGFSPFEDSND